MFNTGFFCENYGKSGDRLNLVDWQQVIEYSLSDDFVKEQKENRKVYCLSHFTFDDGFSVHFSKRNSIAGYSGEYFARQIIIDIDDKEDLEKAKRDSIILLNHLENTLDIQGILIFFSGSKGFNLNLPIENFDIKPCLNFNETTKCFILSEASKIGIEVDNTIYDKARKIRLPNSLNEKSGLFKIPLTKEELTSLSIDEIKELAKEPRQLNLENFSSKKMESPEATKAWQEHEIVSPVASSSKMVLSASAKKMTSLSMIPSGEIINRHTRNFIANGAKEGQRNKQLYQAACNLFKNGFDMEQVEKLLYDPAIKCEIDFAEYQTTINQASKKYKL